MLNILFDFYKNNTEQKLNKESKMTISKEQILSLFQGVGIDLENSEILNCSFNKKRNICSITLDISQLTADGVEPILPPENFEIKELTNGYTEVIKQGKTYTYGKKQAIVIKELYEAYMSGQPWVYGKTLLKKADSAGLRLASLFGGRDDWRELIVGNKQGLYRLNVD